jgi:hypothetical protein
MREKGRNRVKCALKLPRPIEDTIGSSTFLKISKNGGVL